MFHCPAVSAVVVCWRNEEELEDCLRSLWAGLAPEDEVLLVVMDAYARAAPDPNEPVASRVRCLYSDEALGFAAAANAGLRAARGEVVLLLNADWRMEPGTLDAMRQALADDPLAGAVSGSLRNSDGTRQVGYNVRRFPTPLTFAADFLLLHKIFPHNAVTRRHRMLDYDHCTPRPVDVAISCSLLLRRAVLDTVGLFDESLGPSWIEDLDFGRRLRDGGYRLRHCPAATFVHIDSDHKSPRGATTKHLIAWEYHAFFYQSYLRYSAKYFGRRATLFLKACLFAGLLARMVFSGATPFSLRSQLSRRFRVYDPDDVVRKYRGVYGHTLRRIFFDGEAYDLTQAPK